MSQPIESAAVVLAGGFGTRIKHLLNDIPKPMAPVLGRPFIEWLVRYLSKQGLHNIVLSTGYLGEKIAEHFSQNPVAEVQVTCVRESEPIGTAGGFLFAAQQSCLRPSSWLVLNGDSLAFAKLNALFASLKNPQVDGALLGIEVDDASRFGTIRSDAIGRLERFEEKRPGVGIINAGMYLFREKIIKKFPEKRPLSFELDVFPELLANKTQLQVCISSSPFLDIGTPESLAEAESFIGKNLNQFSA
jgi:NDP-sugar pyrophosphorylase family protein